MNSIIERCLDLGLKHSNVKQHSILVIRVNLKDATHSEEHDEAMRGYCLDYRMAIAYLIAKGGLR